MTDQLAYIQNKLDTCGVFDGKGENWAISGSLHPKSNSRILNTNFIQLDQTAIQRSIWMEGGENIVLSNVGVHRGDDPTIGSITDAAGIWISNVTGEVILDTLTVSGNGAGTGIFLYGLENATLNNLRVHDMRWSRDNDPGTEQIVGIWMHHLKNCTLSNPVVRNLDGVFSGSTRTYQTDGIDASGCENFSVVGAQVKNCGEGIDFSGSYGNKFFSVIGGNISDCDSFGLKLANSASHGSVVGVTASRCGYSGFVVSGPVSANLPRCERIRFTNCQVLDVGNNRKWNNYNVSAFSIMTGSYDQDYPQYIEFDNCSAFDTQAPSNRTMKYAFRNEANNLSNKIRNAQVAGFTISERLGTFG